MEQLPIADHLSHLMRKTIGHVVLEPHKYSFKGSALPYCPVRDAINKCQDTNGSAPMRTTTLEEMIRMDIGTTIHTAYQKMLSLQGSLYGGWECQKCKKVFKLMVGPVYHCGRQCSYKEVRLHDAKSDFRGATDALVCYMDGYLLLDFKTKNINKMESAKVERRDRAQVLAYKYLLTRPPFSLKILGQAIIYIAREAPSTFRVCEVENDEMADVEFERYVRLVAASKAALMSGEIDGLPGLCHNQNDEPYCPYNLLCFGPNRAVNLKAEWNKSNYAKNSNQS